jgi:hypothetical protein
MGALDFLLPGSAKKWAILKPPNVVSGRLYKKIIMETTSINTKVRF